MIFPRYSAFRRGFALVGAAEDPLDGFPVWPTAKLRSGGFSNYPPPAEPYTSALGINHPSGDFNGLLSMFDGFASFDVPPTAFPLQITVNNYADDAVAGVDEYDFYVMQRVDDWVWDPSAALLRSPADQYLRITHEDPDNVNPRRSGTIYIDAIEANVAALLPTYLTYPTLPAVEDLRLLLRNVHVYVQRRSDKAYQWAPLYV